jgi:hypothetical protein
MREQELATLLIQMAAEAGMDVERAAEELAGFAVPSFVNLRAFRTAVVDALETQLRAQMEQRLLTMRRRFDVDGNVAGSATPQPRVAYTPPSSELATAPVRQAAGAEVPESAPDTVPPTPVQPDIKEDEMMSPEATMVWTTRSS